MVAEEGAGAAQSAMPVRLSARVGNQCSGWLGA